MYNTEFPREAKDDFEIKMFVFTAGFCDLFMRQVRDFYSLIIKSVWAILDQLQTKIYRWKSLLGSVV